MVFHSIHFQSRFKAIFPDGLIIKKGGMASGLKKAETNEHEPKLFKVAGGVRPVMTEVSSVDITCTLFMFNGLNTKFLVQNEK